MVYIIKSDKLGQTCDLDHLVTHPSFSQGLVFETCLFHFPLFFHHFIVAGKHHPMDEEQQQPSPVGRRKPKFKPKAPPQRKPKPEVNDAINNEEEAALARKLMKKFNENHTRKVPKVEKKAVQPTFGASSSVSTSLRKYGVPGGKKNVVGTSRTGMNDSNNYDHDTAKTDGSIKYISDKIDKLPRKLKKAYREPWDYNYTYYPTTLPLRRPYSGDPELVNKAEFGEAARKSDYDDKTINAASELGLLEECDKERLFLFKIPRTLPFVKRSASAKGKEKAEGHGKGKGTLKKGSHLEDLPEGWMGKIVVYRSGAIKLKLGDTSYDVSSGSDCAFAQDAMKVVTATKDCLTMGEIQKHVVVTPDVDSLLNSI
ncbi:DNA-directed RNA polymerase III subunit rpc4-like [Euphorbia lathyris]|uniref:DNA-directed RNA polymerase III subunit rpc4-like n=1 Tax=Euphorbia lathyris TaxID=212925 RepID=UPI0033134C88